MWARWHTETPTNGVHVYLPSCIYDFKRTDFILEIIKMTSHINIIKVCVVSTQMLNSKMKRCSYQFFPYNKLTWLPRILNIKGTVLTWKREQQLFRKNGGFRTKTNKRQLSLVISECYHLPQRCYLCHLLTSSVKEATFLRNTQSSMHRPTHTQQSRQKQHKPLSSQDCTNGSLTNYSFLILRPQCYFNIHNVLTNWRICCAALKTFKNCIW